MRLTRIGLLGFLSPLAMVAGCGGCDSCFGTKQPGDEAPSTITTATSTPRAVVAPEAGDATEGERDAGNDAGPEAAATEPTPRASGVPRPKAPMPLGAFEVCGVYDGPRCEKSCLKGACRQECDGVECELTCNGGYCSQLCGATGKCVMSCNGGHCVQVCTNPEGCTKSCTGGSCE
jgi:hypothetical protein